MLPLSNLNNLNCVGFSKLIKEVNCSSLPAAVVWDSDRVNYTVKKRLMIKLAGSSLKIRIYFLPPTFFPCSAKQFFLNHLLAGSLLCCWAADTGSCHALCRGALCCLCLYTQQLQIKPWTGPRCQVLIPSQISDASCDYHVGSGCWSRGIFQRTWSEELLRVVLGHSFILLGRCQSAAVCHRLKVQELPEQLLLRHGLYWDKSVAFSMTGTKQQHELKLVWCKET